MQNLLILICTVVQLLCTVYSLDLSQMSPTQLIEILGLGAASKSMSTLPAPGYTSSVSEGEGLSGLVSGGFERLGYIPIGDAVQRCEGKARIRVEQEINRLREQGTSLFEEVSKDLEAKCRGYVEFSANQCQKRIESLIARLQVDGRALLTREQKKCGDETMEVARLVLKQEKEKYEKLGDQEKQRLEIDYKRQGELEMVNIRKKLVDRGKKASETITNQTVTRGEEFKKQITREFELQGEALKAQRTLEYLKMGELVRKDITKEYEKKGDELRPTIFKELVDRGAKMEEDIKKEFSARGDILKENGRIKCNDMYRQACEFVEEGTESDTFCLSFKKTDQKEAETKKNKISLLI